MVRLLAEHDLLRSSYLLGADGVKRHFRGKAWLSSNRNSLKQAIDRGENVASEYILFELGSVLDEQAMDLCRTSKVTPVAAINTFRYTEAGRDEQKGAEEDVARLRRLGVTHYQIDSRYETLFS